MGASKEAGVGQVRRQMGQVKMQVGTDEETGGQVIRQVRAGGEADGAGTGE